MLLMTSLDLVSVIVHGMEYYSVGSQGMLES